MTGTLAGCGTPEADATMLPGVPFWPLTVIWTDQVPCPPGTGTWSVVTWLARIAPFVVCACTRIWLPLTNPIAVPLTVKVAGRFVLGAGVVIASAIGGAFE